MADGWGGSSGRDMRFSYFRIEAPHFVAGGDFVDDKVYRVAPILNYMRGWKPEQVVEYCEKKHWKITNHS